MAGLIKRQPSFARGVARRASRLSDMELAALMRVAQDVGAIDIALGIPPAGPPPSVVAAAVTALESGQHQYAPPEGLLELRQSIAAEIEHTRGVVVDPVNEVTITCGASEGVLDAVLAVTDPGDEVLLPEPYYETYPGVIELAGATCRFVSLRRTTWRLDLDAMRAAVTARTKAILLNNPHNPTGRAFSEDEVTGLVELCAERDLILITDEVYERYVYDGRKHVSPLGMPNARGRAIVISSLSKSLRMSGWRLGYCVAEPELTAVLRRVHERTTVGTSRPLQAGAAAFRAVEFDGQTDCYRDRRNHLVLGLKDLGLDALTPEAGWFVLAGVQHFGNRSDKLAAELVELAGVLVAPGTAFFADRADGLRWIRTTFVNNRCNIDDALARIGRFLHRDGRA